MDRRPVVLVLNGPNLNMLGVRQPEIYGRETLGDIEVACKERALELDVAVEFRQSNYEGELIEWIHEARDNADGIIINPAGLTHTSVPVHDAIKGIKVPVIETHISNIHAREPWRNHSYVSFAAKAVICGFGIQGYALAIDGLVAMSGTGKR